MNIAICFAQFGPYHHARVRAFQHLSAEKVIPLQLSGGTSTYDWSAESAQCDQLNTLCEGLYEQLNPVKVFFRGLRFFRKQKVDVALLPSYAPVAETALFMAAKFAGVRCVMMNESHAGTERATGWKKTVKRLLVQQFDSALVGGKPQKDHFANLGIPTSRIFTGYDAVDNTYFEESAQAARAQAALKRKELGLPEEYFLSLGRMVEKKNLSCLVNAYAQLAAKSLKDETTAKLPALVFVGSGEEEAALKTLCHELSINVVDTHPKSDSTAENEPAVYFYGFRQIDENPTFYALAQAFVLPSLWEEWGLVVNEAMACGLPVIVSETVGSSEDLVHSSQNGYTFNPTSTNELTQHLESISKDPELRKNMGKQSQLIIANWGCTNFAKNAIAAATCAMRGDTSQ